jgi:tRNA (guanine26-N2/guanine27-N2)-dimethyltransferase
MLAATGVRGLRLLAESGTLGELHSTEANAEAFEVLDRNARPFHDRGARARLWDSRIALPGGPFDYVDLDPYGTPVPFLPAAFGALAEPGLLAVTATDMPVLAGVQASACRTRYGAVPVRGRLGPEGGLRILLAYLARCAHGVGRGFRPLLAYVLGHHVRVYVEVAGPDQPLPITELRTEALWAAPNPGIGPFGPMWTGRLFDFSFVGRLEVPDGASDPVGLARLLERFQEEAEVDVPFYYEPNHLAHALGVPRPPPLATLIGELRRLGFRAARSHAQPSAFRTDAPRGVLEEVVRRAVPGG